MVLVEFSERQCSSTHSVIFDRALVAPFFIEHRPTKDAPMLKSGKQLWKYFGKVIVIVVKKKKKKKFPP